MYVHSSTFQFSFIFFLFTQSESFGRGRRYSFKKSCNFPRFGLLLTAGGFPVLKFSPAVHPAWFSRFSIMSNLVLPKIVLIFGGVFTPTHHFHDLDVIVLFQNNLHVFILFRNIFPSNFFSQIQTCDKLYHFVVILPAFFNSLRRHTRVC